MGRERLVGAATAFLIPLPRVLVETCWRRHCVPCSPPRRPLRDSLAPQLHFFIPSREASQGPVGAFTAFPLPLFPPHPPGQAVLVVWQAEGRRAPPTCSYSPGEFKQW